MEKLLERLRKTEQRVLIFSQLTTMLDLIEDFMSEMNYPYERLDGGVKVFFIIFLFILFIFIYLFILLFFFFIIIILLAFFFYFFITLYFLFYKFRSFFLSVFSILFLINLKFYYNI